MILSDVENLISSINYKSQLQQNVIHSAGFRTRRDELQKSLEELEQRVNILKAFIDRNFEKPNISGKTLAVTSQINSISENFRQDAGSIISFNNAVFKSSLKGLMNELDQFILQSWQLYTDRARQINPQVLEGLGSIPIFAKKIERIKLLAFQIGICRKNIPTGEEDFRKFDDLIINAESEWNELGSTELPKQVEDFLRAAGSREGSSLDLLTTDVKEWLSQKEIDNSFRIYMKSSAA